MHPDTSSTFASFQGNYFVYAIRMAGQQEPLVKVGMSKSPLKRLAQLQTSSPFPLELTYLSCPMTKEEAVEAERGFHVEFADSRLSGEWFKFESDNTVKGLAFALDALKSENGETL